MNGLHYLGLDYGSVQAAMDLIGWPGKKRAVLFDELQAMEAAALPVLNQIKG